MYKSFEEFKKSTIIVHKSLINSGCKLKLSQYREEIVKSIGFADMNAFKSSFLKTIENENCITEENDSALAAIKYALNDFEGLAFLRCWYHGDFTSLKEEWDNVPDEVFIGADPLFKPKNG